MTVFRKTLQLKACQASKGKKSYLTSLFIFSSPELAQDELLGYSDVRRPSYVWTSVTSETSVRQLFSLCTL